MDSRFGMEGLERTSLKAGVSRSIVYIVVPPTHLSIKWQDMAL